MSDRNYNHKQLACRGDCIVSTDDYWKLLKELTENIVVETTRRLGPEFTRLQLYADNNEPDIKISLLIPLIIGAVYLHGYSCDDAPWFRNPIVSYLGDDNLLQIIVGILSEQKGDDVVWLKFDHRLEVLLWCVTSLQDTAKFSAILRKNSNILPKCVVSSLLGQAVNKCFDEGVRLLIELGLVTGKTQIVVGGIDTPLLLAVFRLSFSVDDEEQLLNANRLVTILKVLLENGASFDGFDDDTVRLVLFSLPHIAIASSEAVRLILENLPHRAFTSPTIQFHDNNSPLLNAFDSAVDYYMREAINVSQTSLRQNQHLESASVLIFACLPLLRAGCVARPDRFYGLLTSNVQDLAVFFRSNQRGRHESLRLWGRHEVALQFLVEIRGQSGVDVPDLCDITMDTVAQMDQQDELLTTLARQFPRKLQYLCRTEILRQLPIGVKQRPLAISQLGLPDSLSAFLNFADLDGTQNWHQFGAD